MKKRILSILLVVAMLTVAAVFTVQADAPLTKDAADAIIADVSSTLDTNAAFDATSNSGTVSAVCPYCGGEVKTWEPLPAIEGKPSAYTADKHFYVPVQTEGEFVTNGRYYLNGEGKTICIYLNGQTINDSISDTAAFMVTKGTLNFLGSGTVKAVASPGANKAGARGVLDVGGSAAGSTINVFGGTFESTGTAPTVTIRSQYTSAVNVYDGTIGSTAQTVETVRFIGGSNKSNGTFNLFDGTVNAGTGKSAIEFSTVNSYKAHGAEVNISGGTVNSGNVTGGGIYMDVAATVNMSGGLLANSGDKHTVYISDADAEFNLSGNGTINGGVYVDNEDCEVSVDGTAVISSDNGGLDLTSGALLTLGDNLAAGADITVTVNEGAFTKENANAAAIAAAGYIKSTVTAKAVFAVDNKLTLGTVADAANAMSFTQDTTAVCPYCGTVESWTALSTSAGTVASGHYYLDPNATYNISTYYTVNSDVCLHLNGQNITSSGRVFWVNLPSGGSAFEMTVMGSGNVTGVGTASSTVTSNRGAVFDVSHNNSKNKTATPVLNLFGGTYATSNTSSILTMRTYFSGSTFYNWPTEVNMYGGELAGSETQVYASLMTLTGTATFNLHGGTITGGKAASTAGSIYSYAGKTVNKGKSTINMTGGTITGGNGKTGGNINLQAGSEFNMSGGLVTLGVASGNGGNIYAIGASGNITTVNISGTAQITAGQAKGSAGGGGLYLSSDVTATMSGGKISGNSSTYSTSVTEKCGGGNVTLGGAIMTMTGGEISGGTSHFRGGNIYIRSIASSLTVSDDALISGGTAIDGGNISSLGTLEISGGTIQNGEASHYGGNIHAVASGSLTISGDANITSGKATTRGGNIYIDEITAEMTGGTVTLGQPTDIGASILRGGNVCVESGATFDMTGGTVSNGTAYEWGGNFNISGIVNISGTAQISNGTVSNASGYASSIALMSSAAEFNVSGGEAEFEDGQIGEYEEEEIIGGDSGGMEYYFMSGEGVLSPSNGDYFSKWGDSTLIKFPNGETMLIDTGVQNYYNSLKQRLHSLGVYSLDYVLITHPHDDHCGGVWGGLLNEFSVGQVYHSGLKNGAWGTASASVHIENICEANAIPCTVIEAGDSLTFGQVTMKVLWPRGAYAVTDGQLMTGSGKLNNRSLVLRFDYGQHSSLFPGDLYKTYSHTGAEMTPGEVGGENALLEYYSGTNELDVDLLKLLHHGDSSSSNSPEFFSATTPELAVATGFIPIESHWGLYKYTNGEKFNPNKEYNKNVLFDRYNGYIHVTASSGGSMSFETSRNGYLPDFGATWNPVLDRS